MNYRVWIRALRKNWWIVVVVTLLAVGTGALITLLTPKQYQSSVTFFLRTPAEQVGSANQGDQFAQKRVNSYVQLLKSRRLANLIVQDTGLDRTAGQISSAISAQGDPLTVLLTATVTDTDQARSLRIAESLAGQFVAMIASLETPLGGAAPTVSLEVTSEPTLRPQPVAPVPRVILGLALLIGLPLGLALALLREVLDTSIRSVDQLKERSGRPVLGVIPSDPDAALSPVITEVQSRSARAEGYRELRTNLRFADVDDPVKVVLITSSSPAEGKSSTAGNLALSFAAAECRVLLIDGDLRKPKLTEYLGVEGGVGLTNVLADQVHLEEVAQPWGRSGLTVLPSGPIPPNPAELLGSRAMASLVAAARERYDMIIIDSPPLLPVTDAAVLVGVADGVVLVVRHGSTTRAQLALALSRLDAVGARVLGTVMSMAPLRGADRYGYGYGSGYGNDAQAPGLAAAVRRPVRPVDEPARGENLRGEDSERTTSARPDRAEVFHA